MRKLCIFTAFALFATPSLADGLYDRCINQSNTTNADYATCGAQWLQRADNKLNEVWKKVYRQTDGATKSDLLNEQRSWNKFKEDSCKFYANGDWGREGQAINFPACRAAIIEARIKALQDYGKFFQGQ
ncbi:lysozyme inhibitor LprI family protein [Daeguia caeni]|uniref:Lysozyme inhibitor LprI family protein n=1 Tax=Daeguia caeni TaxID=439612 RepID=A0ABV9H6B8_9HYPH